MNAATENVLIAAPKDEVYRLVSDLERLPEWATEFAPTLTKERGRHKVVNAQGEFFIRFECDPTTGVIDMLVGPTAETLLRLPTRVVALEPSLSLFSFTLIQPPGMPAEVFSAQLASVRREIEGLKRILEPA